ncbi:MAG: L-2-hydroxyglutarate oxidase [Planctomycetota bacterium]
MTQSTSRSDFVVIGAGIVGLATAWRLSRRYPDCTVAVVETERQPAEHQSGRNSGVIHSGIYYKPGSTKAITCRTGKALMEQFCDEHQIPWDRCGKVVVAITESELASLERIAERAEQNGVEFEHINSDQLRELEPNAAGVSGLHVPETGIVDYRSVCLRLAELIVQQGGAVHYGSRITRIDHTEASIQLHDERGNSFEAGTMINCAGLHSDHICRLAGGSPEVQIVPFRGEYYELRPDRESLVKNLIYPVPDPSFPFLGVHFTRMIGGGVECGPNAVLALSREGYDWSRIRIGDLMETFRFGGFRKLARQHWRMGLGEMNRSLRKSAFVRALRRLLPAINSEDLVRGRAGVRAQAVSPDGKLVDDFLIQTEGNAIHVLNAPSPAATASLAIADKIVEATSKP